MKLLYSLQSGNSLRLLWRELSELPTTAHNNPLLDQSHLNYPLHEMPHQDEQSIGHAFLLLLSY
jgi:hypothetical protein